MSTGFDELLWAVTNYDPEHPDYEELSDIGDGQYLASAAADLIQELRRGLATARAEARELRNALQFVRVRFAAHMDASDKAAIDAALSQPAAEQPAEFPPASACVSDHCPECSESEPECVCEDSPQPAEYRLLTRADKIAATDELLRDDCVTWAPVAGDLCKGMQYNPDFFVPVRRRVGAAPAAQEGRDDA